MTLLSKLSKSREEYLPAIDIVSFYQLLVSLFKLPWLMYSHPIGLSEYISLQDFI